MIDWEKIDFFERWEFECRCGCGDEKMDPNFMLNLDNLRRAYGSALTVGSGWRCPTHNVAVSPKTGKVGPHTTGKAVDLVIRGAAARSLLMLTGRWPHTPRFTGIGIRQHGPHSKRIIHLDGLKDNETLGPRPWVWSYS